MRLAPLGRPAEDHIVPRCTRRVGNRDPCEHESSKIHCVEYEEKHEGQKEREFHQRLAHGSGPRLNVARVARPPDDCCHCVISAASGGTALRPLTCVTGQCRSDARKRRVDTIGNPTHTRRLPPAQLCATTRAYSIKSWPPSRWKETYYRPMGAISHKAEAFHSICTPSDFWQCRFRGDDLKYLLATYFLNLYQEALTGSILFRPL